jgi:hypothetical protein
MQRVWGDSTQAGLMVRRGVAVAVAMGVTLAAGVWPPAVWSAQPANQAAVEGLAQAIVTELKRACPLADAAAQTAFEACKRALFADSAVKRALPAHVLWGRQAEDPGTSLKDSRLTQFSPDVYAGLYLPLFMFDGSVSVSWVESEKLYRVKLGAAFRNRLAPGQFPYPFWHDAAKWRAYENANALLLWVAPCRGLRSRWRSFHGVMGPWLA